MFTPLRMRFQCACVHFVIHSTQANNDKEQKAKKEKDIKYVTACVFVCVCVGLLVHSPTCCTVMDFVRVPRNTFVENKAEVSHHLAQHCYSWV